MKKNILAVMVVGMLAMMLGGFLPLQKVQAENTPQAEHIEHFDTTVAVQKDTSIIVTESITYTFADGDQKHGIYRDIPISSSRISNISVKDENGQAYKFTKSGSGSNTSIKIGDANVLIEGTHTYVLNYTVSDAIGNFKDFDEIYWNATGNEWAYPIAHTTQTIIIPSVVTKDALRISCYSGDKGSTASCDGSPSITTTGNTTTVSFAQSASLAPYQGVTVAIGFPKGIVVYPTLWQKFVHALYNSVPTILAVVIFIIALIASIRKWGKGRDPKGAGVIIAEYDVPEKLHPIEVAALLNKKVKNADLSAEIILLAVKGFLKIEKLDKTSIFKSADYQFTLLKGIESAEDAIDKKLLIGFFGEEGVAGNTVLLSDLKSTLYKVVADIKKDALNNVTTRGYFLKNPTSVRTKAAIIGFLGVFLVLVIGSSAVAITGSIFILPLLILSVLMYAIATYHQTARTQKGVEVKEYVLGLKEYLQIAEKDRINFHNAPEKKPELFEALLPYAMVLGVEKAWAKEFADVYVTPPNWYIDPNMRGFNSLILLNSFSDFNASTVSSFAAPASSGSGGGGFSGGGGGGGGGGSW